MPIYALQLGWVLVFLLFLSLLLNAALLFRFVYSRQTRVRTRLMKATLVLSTTLLIFFVLEFTFAFVVKQSDGFGTTLASRLWFQRYWQPINSFGYRDYEKKEFENRRVVFFVGDSIVAGHGINDIEDRFANKMYSKLDDNWEFVIIAKNGWATDTEFSAMTNYPAKPDLVILSYYPNDIQNAAETLGYKVTQYFQPPHRLIEWIIEKSFFLNWVYWRLIRLTMGDDYWNYLVQSYNNEDIWKTHAAQLQQFVDYKKSRNIALFVVVWPNLFRVSESEYITSKVAEFFRTQSIPVLDLAKSFRGRKTSDLVVNMLDGHANPRTNEEVANLIYTTLEQAGILGGMIPQPANKLVE